MSQLELDQKLKNKAEVEVERRILLPLVASRVIGEHLGLNVCIKQFLKFSVELEFVLNENLNFLLGVVYHKLPGPDLDELFLNYRPHLDFNVICEEFGKGDG